MAQKVKIEQSFYCFEKATKSNVTLKIVFAISTFIWPKFQTLPAGRAVKAINQFPLKLLEQTFTSDVKLPFNVTPSSTGCL
jgi:hypothetical protein